MFVLFTTFQKRFVEGKKGRKQLAGEKAKERNGEERERNRLMSNGEKDF